MSLTHSQHLERWLGADAVENMSKSMKGWYGPPIRIGNVPGRGLMVHGDGGFSGKIEGGAMASLKDYAMEGLGKFHRGLRRMVFGQRKNPKLCAGFSSLSDLISEMTVGGKRQQFMVAKTGVAGIANVANNLWDVGANPAAGSVSSSPSGSSPDNTTTGGLCQENPSGGDTLHFIQAVMAPTVANNNLLMYDRFFQTNHTMTVASRDVTGVPTRYQSAAAAGTFITVFVTTVLPASTPTHTITYMDDAGNTPEDAAARTIVSASIARRFPFASSVGNGWFIPLNNGDKGVRKITNVELSGAMASGATDVVLAKPLVWIPQPIANMPIMYDGINSSMNLVQIEDNACLAFMEVCKGATNATSYNGMITLCSG